MSATTTNRLIISDTSCLIAFANIGRFDLLEAVCKTVIVTPEVAAEYKDPLPEWIQVISDEIVSALRSTGFRLPPAAERLIQG
jgi:predicted nucleic acid-binding protein